MIHREEIDLAEVQLIGYDNLYRGESEKIVHFFLDDYKFEAVWNNPDSKIDRLREYRAVLSPQFSVYTEMMKRVQPEAVLCCGKPFEEMDGRVLEID